MNVDKNGVLLFYAQDQLCDSDPLTSPGMPHPNGISVLWAQNINVNNPVKLYYTTSGEAGNRRFVITWYHTHDMTHTTRHDTRCVCLTAHVCAHAGTR